MKVFRMPWLRAWSRVAVDTFTEIDHVKAFNAAQREEAARTNAEGRVRVAARKAAQRG